MVSGKTRMVRRDKVDFEFPSMEDTLSPLANMVPLKSMMKAQRLVMASRMLTQALPLKGGEAPLVRSAVPGQEGKSFEDEYSKHMGVVRADEPLRVLSVTPDAITVKRPDGSTDEIELYNNQPYNRKTFLHNTPTVSPGDEVQPGQLLATSNFATADGSTALGANARVAYVPFRGMNFEDAIVISESMSKRLTSEHMYQNQLDLTDKNVAANKKRFVSLYPSKLSRKQLENYDDDGMIKPGTEVREGDPLILAVKQRDVSRNKMHKGRKPSYADASVTWEHHSPGIVTDIAVTDKGAMAIVKSQESMNVGDKLSGRYGDKGVIAGIIPDDEMPQGGDGRPFEVLLNPLGVITRTNPAQLVEAALGKIAEKTGKPYTLPDFDSKQDMVEWAIGELQKHGLSDLDDIVDPERESKIKDVMTGNRFFMKLHHTAEGKGQARSFANYTMEGTPAKGGKTGAKRVGMLEVGSLLSHGATDVLRDASLVRGQANQDYWQQYMSGAKPPSPKVPHVYEKFVGQLKAAGINVIRDGTQSHLMAMTNKDVDTMTGGREITNVETVDWKNKLKPVKGGLFDEGLTGGHNGNKWSYIKLHEPLPSPVMEEPIRRLLGLTAAKFDDIIAGKDEFQGKSGPSAISAALQRVDLDKEIERARADIKSGKRTLRDTAVRRLGYLKSAKRMNLHPKEWVLDKVPVLPPAFRPVSTMGANKLPLVSDPNYLYKEVFDANQTWGQMSELVDDVGEERLSAYKAFKAVTGLGDPIHPKNKERNVKGILKHVFGSSPKLGVVQRRLLGSTTDLVGRAVITPNPDLDMDHVGLPESKAWEVYKPHVIRNLVKRGFPRVHAANAVKEQSATARKALLAEMDRRPLVVNRAPTLHRYGMMAFRPKLVKGETLQVSPLIVGGFAADFDGDTMQYHAPQLDEAVDEAYEKMLPSKNLFAASDFKVHYKPSREYAGGLWAASAYVDKQKPRVYHTKKEARRAYQRGEIGVGQEVHILED
jgi:hypothetical protein